MATTKKHIKSYSDYLKEQAPPLAAPVADASSQETLTDIDRLRQEILDLENQLLAKKNELQNETEEYTQQSGEANRKNLEVQQQNAIAAANQQI